jgi:plasmid stabilization system protein ParE
MRIRYTPRSLADLQRIHAYIAERNPPAADRVAGVIKTRIDSLRPSPAIGYRSNDPTIRIHIRHMARKPPTGGEL